MIGLLHAAVEQELKRLAGLGEGATGLLERLAQLRPVERLALVDALDRALIRIETGAKEAKAPTQVGLSERLNQL